MKNQKKGSKIEFSAILNSNQDQQERFQLNQINSQKQMSQFSNSFTSDKIAFQTENQIITFSDHTHLQKNIFQSKDIQTETGMDKLFQDHLQSATHFQPQKIIAQNESQLLQIESEKISDKSYNPSEQYLELDQAQSSSYCDKQGTECASQRNSRKRFLTQDFNLTRKEQIFLGNKVLSGLEKNIVSLPFRQPVDVVSLEILDYLQIVKEPMDLRTIKKKLSEDMYAHIDQIYDDIQLIISNSLRYNELNPDFIKLTRNFQKSYNKIRRDCQRNMKRYKIEEQKKKQLLKSQMITKKYTKTCQSHFPSNEVQIVSSYRFEELTKLAKKIKKLQSSQQIELFQKIGITNTMIIDIKILTTKQIRNLIKEVQKIEKSKQDMIRNEEKKQNSHITACDNNFRNRI